MLLRVLNGFFCERKCLFYLVFFPINFGHVSFGWWRLFVSFSGFSPINFHLYLSIIFDNKHDDKEVKFNDKTSLFTHNSYLILWLKIISMIKPRLKISA